MTLRAAILCLLLLLAAGSARADTQNFKFDAPAGVDDSATPEVMRDLAARILPVYEEQDPLLYLQNLSALQLVVGDYKSAQSTRQSLQDRRQHVHAGPIGDRTRLLDIYTQAQAEAAADDKLSFTEAFDRDAGAMAAKLDNPHAYAFTSWHGAPPDSFGQRLQLAFDRLRHQHDIAMPQAIGLIRTYLAYHVYQDTRQPMQAVAAADAGRRYVTEDHVRIRGAGGVELQASIVRPKNAKPLPTLLEFTISRSATQAIACAAHGYVGVVAHTRGSEDGDDQVTPFEHDGADARAVIRWIAQQPWSDGRVGMYGDGYSGFAAWSAAKHLPKALKAIATINAMAPGISFPAQGRIYRNSAYRWLVDHTQGSHAAGTGYDAFWQALNQAWYRSGKPYRALDRMAKIPSHIFLRWLNHPSFDLYWRRLTPNHWQFDRFDIPVLQMTGYYAQGQAGSLHYFSGLARNRPNADSTLLIGPYDDSDLQSGSVAPLLGGHRRDPIADLDFRELRFQWFDHIFKGTAKPTPLKARINYEIMGDNRWGHADSLKTMSPHPLTLYLNPGTKGGPNQLTTTKPAKGAGIDQTVDFRKRDDATALPGNDLLQPGLQLHHAVMYVGQSLKKPLVISGRLSVGLDFSINKYDMDFYVRLYEQRRDGQYLALTAPYEQRASYVRDPVHRQLLVKGGRQHLSFDSPRMVGRKLDAGSRLVLVLGINKRPDQEINYGAAGDVSAESIKDAGKPLKIRWYGDSHIEIPQAGPDSR